MERIILIETSTALCSVALAEDGAITAYRESSAAKAHASLTAVFVQEVLQERGIKLEDCDAVCVSMGPGSYTGLRVGENHAGNRQYRARDNRTQRVGEDVTEHNTAVARTKRSCSQNVFLIFETIELHTHTRRHTDPTCQEEGYEQDRQLTCVAHVQF